MHLKDKTPVFPLPIFLLPQGVTRLRIFEQRYLKLVKIASQGHGFAILPSFIDKASPLVASWVDIINFSDSEEGLLIIDVKCQALVKLDEAIIDQDQLMLADITAIEHWPIHQHNKVTLQLSQFLARFFADSDELSKLYQEQFVDQPNWVIARLLELLPIADKDKVSFYQQDSYQDAQRFLMDVLSHDLEVS